MEINAEKPEIGNWYSNLTGQLFKIILISYTENDMIHMTIEYINGEKQIISKTDWDFLELSKARRKRKK